MGLYVHVPFCGAKCRYCDFCSGTPAPGEMDGYLRALKTEIRLRVNKSPVRTVYVGGGTPSFFGGARLGELLDALQQTFRLQPDCEITVEANPADVTGDWPAGCRTAGVNRLSLGVQGMRDEDLRFLGRRHSVAEAVDAGQCARAAGFNNLGVDLIVGLPGHTPEITRKILAQAVAAFAPEHFSCYQLTCAPGTPLYDACQRGEFEMPDDDVSAAIFMATHETLGRFGYEGYEVSNFARTRALRSRHNSAYWTRRNYVGLGLSAHSFLSPIRSWNTTSLTTYCASLKRGKLPCAGEERLTDTQRAAEVILLGLRVRDGFSLQLLRSSCGLDLLAEKGAFLDSAESEGLLQRRGEQILPTLRGMAMADYLAVELAP